MNLLASKKIKTKLTATMILITSIGMAFILLVFIVNDAKLIESNLKNRINTQMEFFSANIGPSVLFDDRISAEEILNTLKAEKSILSAELYDKNNQLFGKYLMEEAKRNYYIRSADTFKVEKDVIFDNEKVGKLSFLVTEHDKEKQVRNLIIYAITTYLVSTIIVYFIALRSQRMFSKPVISLNNIAKKVADTQNYNLRAKVYGDDEIGELSKQFNIMLKQINQRDQMLEKKVQQRTSELEKLADEFRHRAFHDNLTGLRNRAYLADYFEKAIAHSQRYEANFSILLLDLDNFKTINDTMGHEAGDELLKAVSRRLLQCLRKDDLIIRLGGDEFVVLLENVKHKSHVEFTAENIIESVAQDCRIEDQVINITVSVGGSIYPQHGTSLTELKRNADTAMYRSKQRGRNQFTLYSNSMESNIS